MLLHKEKLIQQLSLSHFELVHLKTWKLENLVVVQSSSLRPLIFVCFGKSLSAKQDGQKKELKVCKEKANRE